METSFFYDTTDKQLCFKLKERLKTVSDIELKGNGLLNPSNGKLIYSGTLKKYYTSEKKSSSTRLGAGFSLGQKSKGSLEPANPLLHVSAEQRTPLFNGPNTVFTVKGKCDYNVQEQAFGSRRGAAYICQKIPNLSAHQDIQLKAGYDFTYEPAQNRVKKDLRLQVRENNWAVNYRTGRWSLTYDL